MPKCALMAGRFVVWHGETANTSGLYPLGYSLGEMANTSELPQAWLVLQAVWMDAARVLQVRMVLQGWHVLTVWVA